MNQIRYDENGRPVVRLTRDQLFFGGQGGLLRAIDARILKREEFFPHVDPWGRDIDSTIGEEAVALYRNRFWFPSYDNPAEVPADIGLKGQVRNTKFKGKPHLFIYPPKANGRRDAPDDKDDHAFVLVDVKVPDVTLYGWILARDARQPEHWKAPPEVKLAAWVLEPEHLVAFPGPEEQAVAA